MTAVEKLWTVIKEVETVMEKNKANREIDDITRERYNAFYVGKLQGLHQAIQIIEADNS